MKKDKNFIARINSDNFRINTHFRALQRDEINLYKKSDVLKLLQNKNGYIKSYCTFDGKNIRYTGNFFYKKTLKGYRIGCKYYPDTFMSKVKKRLLKLK